MPTITIESFPGDENFCSFCDKFNDMISQEDDLLDIEMKTTRLRYLIQLAYADIWTSN